MLEGHEEEMMSVVVTPDGRQVVSGGGDATARVWGLETGFQEHLLHGYDREVWPVAVTPDGQSVVTGGEDSQIRVLA